MKTILAFVAALFISSTSHAQHPELDSLFAVWQDRTQVDSTRVNAYKDYIWKGFLFSKPDSAFSLAEGLIDYGTAHNYPKAKAFGYKIQGISWFKRGDHAKALASHQRGLTISEEIGDRKGTESSLGNIGNIYSGQSNYILALEYYQRSLKIGEEIGDKQGIGSSLNNIGRIYYAQRSYPQALDNFQRSLKIEEEIGDEQGISRGLNNIGNVYSSQGDHTQALDQYQRSLKVSEENGDKEGMAIAPNNIGNAYFAQGNYPQALEHYQRGLKIREEIGDKKGIAIALINIGSVHRMQGLYFRAINDCKRSLDISKENGSFEGQRSACSCLYETYKATGNDNKALAYFERMATLDDSLNTGETNKKLQQMEFDKVLLADSLKQEKEKAGVQLAHQKEVAQKDMVRNLLMGGGLLFVILSVGFFNRWRYVKNSRDLISFERDRSERLLLNILPAEIAEELKAKGRADARDFELVTILFTDFKGFTEASAILSAQELVSEINACFEFFDGIMGKYGIEKIKTIGDAYMCAGGLPVPNADSPRNTVLAALDMQDFMKRRKVERDLLGLSAFEMRCGIHTGPVVAGIVGVKKFAYDIWGDTVNTASRMESSGEVGQVNISEATYELVKDVKEVRGAMEVPAFTFTHRGKVQAKGKGEMEMYFVTRVA